MAERCAQEKLLPWIVGIAILVCVTYILAFCYGDNIRQARRDAAASHSSVGEAQVRPSAPAGAAATAFVPPWHQRSPDAVSGAQRSPDAVSGATPKPVASFKQAIRKVSPSVVGVNTSGNEPRSGSGIIVHDQGGVLTNYHVVNGATSIVVTLVHEQLVRSYPAHVVRTRPDLDLALLQVGPTGGVVFPPAPLGDSNKTYIGQQVLAIGNPFGLAQSASAGIISNNQRTLSVGGHVFRGLIQTDASINPGSSGGALVTSQGEVIGVNTAIFSPVEGFTGVGFAVPINLARQAFPDYMHGTQPAPVAGNGPTTGGVARQVALPVVEPEVQLTAGGDVRQAWAGIDVTSLNHAVVHAFRVPVRRGVLVNRVFADSPGEKAGLQRGDVIYRIDNRRVKDTRMLWARLANKQAGDTVKMTVFRNRSRKTFAVTLEPEPPNIRALLSKTPRGGATGETGEFGIEELSWLGIDIQPIESGEALQEFGIDPSETGVLVGEVEGIAAVDAGLMPGDLIKKVNNHEIRDIATFKEVIKRIDLSEGVVLDIMRQGRPFYITVHPARRDRGAWQ